MSAVQDVAAGTEALCRWRCSVGVVGAVAVWRTLKISALLLMLFGLQGVRRTQRFNTYAVLRGDLRQVIS